MNSTTSQAVLVVGTGPVGLVAALALARSGLAVTLAGPAVTPATAQADRRTTALFGGSIALLQHLGVWDELASASAPLTGLRIIDDTGGLLRAPDAAFTSAELGLPAFGFNVPNEALLAALAAAIEQSSEITWRSGLLTSLDCAPDSIRARLTDGTDGEDWRGGLVVGADGRNSLCRREAGITAVVRELPQAAVIAKFRHSRPHKGVSTELHRRAGPLTIVPLPGDCSSLVWVETRAEAHRLAQIPDAAFARLLDERLQGLVGVVGGVCHRASIPLYYLNASSSAEHRVMLAGEAAHVMPPIGAQGLNLGFRDVAWIAEIAGESARDGLDMGEARALAAYAAARKADIAGRMAAVDWLNRSLLADLLPLDLVRGAGLALLGAVGPLRKLVMQQGLGPSGPLPPLLRPQPRA